MAYTGTAPTVYLNVCESPQPAPGAMIGLNCQASLPVKTTAFFPVDSGLVVPDAQKLSDLFGAIILLVAMVFIIAMLKKAIEK